jgi:hypothetical protein
MSLDLLTPDQISHLWSTACALVLTDGLKTSADNAINYAFQQLGSLVGDFKGFVAQKVGIAKVSETFEAVSQDPGSQDKKNELTEVLDMYLSKLQLKELQEQLISVQEAVNKLQTVSQQQTVGNVGAGALGAAQIAGTHNAINNTITNYFGTHPLPSETEKKTANPNTTLWAACREFIL